MKWRRTKNKDVIDQRGAGPASGGGLGGGLGGGGGMPIPIPTGRGGKLGGVGLIIVLIVIGLQVFGGGGGGGAGNSFGVPDSFDNGSVPGSAQPDRIPPNQDPQAELKDFSSFVFSDSQNMWRKTFAEQGKPYDNAQLVLYTGAVNTGGCGHATSAVGPFYCPADKRVYLDLSFYDDLARQLGAPGDFAWAYVIAHEMGHHVQKEIGTEAQVRDQQRANPDQANQLSVRVELQADCYAGVWGSTVNNLLEPGDLDEAMVATEAIGDDRLQQRGGGTVNPDSFTHGTSEQRKHWFQTGYESGDPAACDTFSADSL